MPAAPMVVNARCKRPLSRCLQIDTPAKLCDFNERKHAVRATAPVTAEQGHVAGWGDRRHRARLYRAVVPGGELRRSPAHHPRKFGAAADLPAVACDLLHVMDILRLGRIGVALRL